MKVIYGLRGLERYKRPVVALGVFDGVHRGHRRILKGAVAEARRIRGTSVVLTFWPHPQKQSSLYSLEHRIRLIGELGIDVCIVINFNKKFSQVLPEKFIKDILFKKLHAYCIYVGRNFRFGKDASGSQVTLKKLSNLYGYKLKVFEVVKVKNLPISSTAIRLLIKNGRLDAARELLARRVSILGTVIKGSSWGTILGFPTANIDPHHEVIPPKGVYAVWIDIENNKLKGICYIGTRPTFRNKALRRIEVHIYNFSNNLYGKYLEIQFIKKIRDEQKFNSVYSLSKQIKKDINKSNGLFSRH